MKNEDYTMGGNGVYGYEYYDGSYGYNEYFKNLTGFFTRSLNYAPGNIWNARNATQMWNSTTYDLAFPYGQYYNFTGRPRYVVASAQELPYSVAMGLHGYSSAPTYADLIAARDAVTMKHQLSTRPSRVNAKLQQIKSIGEWKDNEALADYPEYKTEAKEIEEEAKKLEKKLELVMKPESPYSESGRLETIAEIEKEAAALGEKAKTLYDKCKKAEAEYQEQKAKEEKEKLEEQANNSSEGDAVGDTSVTTTEGDKKMDTDALATEYGVKKPVIVSDQDVSTVAQELKTHTNNDDDAKDYKYVSEMFSTGKINAGNIVEVLDEYDDYEKLYDGIYEMDNSKEIMTTLLSTLQARVKLLKDNGYITAAEYSDYTKKISNVKKNLGGDAKDIANSEPTIKMTNTSTNTSQNLKLFSKYLKEYVIDKIKGKGVQADFDAKVKAKQNERTTKATADFYKDHATGKAGKEVNGTPALPAGITYLPNSKEFQWKYDSTTIFKGKSYKELGDKILASKKTEVIAKWNDILKEMDKNLKDKPAS